MGCGSCCPSDQTPLAEQHSLVNNQEWANAVATLNIGGIQMLHATDPDLIDEPIDVNGTRAIHVAIMRNEPGLLKYLLQNGANVNIKGGKDGNTALHHAAMEGDSLATKWLFASNADPLLSNRFRKRPLELCTKRFRREYIKAKQARKQKHRLEEWGEQLRQKSPSPRITVGGISMDDIEEFREFIHHSDCRRSNYTKMKKLIDVRDGPVSEFGKNTGIDVDEIGMIFQRITSREKLWDTWIAKRKSEINKQTDIYKVIFGLTWLALKKKNGLSTPKPESKPIKKITKILCFNLLPKKGGRAFLTKKDFINNFHSYLYSLHTELMDIQNYQSELDGAMEHETIPQQTNESKKSQ